MFLRVLLRQGSSLPCSRCRRAPLNPPPLVDAAARGDHAAVRALIGQKIDVNAARVDGMTALHAAVHADRLDIADALLRAGAKAAAARSLRRDAALSRVPSTATPT